MAGNFEADLPLAPFPLSQCVLEEARRSVKDGASQPGPASRSVLRRRSESLTDLLASIQSIFQGKGAPGVSGGLSPWRSMRQRLMRAVRRAASPQRMGRRACGCVSSGKAQKGRKGFQRERNRRFRSLWAAARSSQSGRPTTFEVGGCA